MATYSIEEMIDQLTYLLGRQFPDDISNIYFGDVGIYPPRAFRDHQGNERAIVSLIPNYMRPQERSTGSEFWDLGLFIVVMVNMIPYFETTPQEAFGERRLTNLTTRIAMFMAQDINFDLEDEVLTTKVGDINWEWMQRQELSIRAAAIEYEAQIEVSRNL